MSVYPHYVPSLEEVGSREVFIVVRNPVGWLSSLYHHRKRDNWRWSHANAREIDIICGANDFDAFINNVISNPGVVERYFDLFTKQYEGYPKLVIGRNESLCDDLISFLDKAGEHFDSNIIRNVPPYLRGDARERFPAHLIEQLRESERHLFEKYGY